MELRSALEYLREVSNAEHFERVLSEHDEDTYLNKVTGERVTVQKQKPPMKSKFLCLSSLLQFVKMFPDPIIFINPDSIMVVMDYELGVERFGVNTAGMELKKSDVFYFLSVKTTGSPKQVSASLRFSLHSAICSVIPSDLYARIEHLKFETQSEETHRVKPLDEGVSKSMRSRVTGESEIPDQFSVSFQMYPSLADASVNTAVNVQLSLQIDPAQSTVSVRPFPGQLELAERRAMTAIMDAIAKRCPELTEKIFLGFHR